MFLYKYASYFLTRFMALNWLKLNPEITWIDPEITSCKDTWDKSETSIFE